MFSFFYTDRHRSARIWEVSCQWSKEDLSQKVWMSTRIHGEGKSHICLDATICEIQDGGIQIVPNLMRSKMVVPRRIGIWGHLGHPKEPLWMYFDAIRFKASQHTLWESLAFLIQHLNELARFFLCSYLIPGEGIETALFRLLYVLQHAVLWSLKDNKLHI